MASLATGFVSKKLKSSITERAKVYEPQNPYYIYETLPNGKTKKKRRDPPPGLTKQQAKLWTKIARRAHYLDKGIQIGPFRFGWTFIVGVVPGLGDAAAAGLNWFLVVKPSKKGFDLPQWLVSKMLFNNAISAGVGLIPFAGDIMLAIWKANSRNVGLLEEYLRVIGEAQIAQGLPNLTKGENHYHGVAAKGGKAAAAAGAAAGGSTHPAQTQARTDAQEVLRASSGQLDTATASGATAADVEKARTSRFSLRGRKGNANGAAAPAASTKA
ncbi:hypothetical protein V8E36_003445 [Tilletia maclaganii]